MIGHGRRLAACFGLAALALTACGKKTSPIAPEDRAPQPIADLTATVHEDTIVLSWTPPLRRVDNTRIRDFTTMRIFRVDDGGVGEPKSAMLADGKIAGLAVNIGARVAGLAGPGEILVSSTVKDLVAGSDIRFEDRGAAELKGVPGEWQIFAVAKSE